MTQSAKDYLRAEIDRKITEAGEITDAASKANVSLTADEKKKVEGLLSEVAAAKARVEEMEENERINAQIEEMRRKSAPTTERTGDDDGQGGRKASETWGASFVKSSAYKGLQHAFKSGALTGNWTSGSVELPFDAKATLDSTGYPFSEVGADVRPGIQPTLLRRLTIADLIAPGTTDSSIVRYVQETTFTNGADTVAEGADKPESAFVFDNVDEPVRKIATFLPITDEMLEDAAQMRSYLDGRLRLAVQHTEEDQLLNGSGTAPDLRGLLNRTGVQTLAVAAGSGNSTIAEYLYNAITNIRVNALVEPDGIVMHPTNYAALRLAKNSQNGFDAGGPFGGQAGNQVWGLPVAVTSAIAVNTALIGAFRTQAQVFRRNGLTVEASNSHADFFKKNMTAIRAEERLALAVYRPQAFHTVTGLQNAASA